MQEPNERYWELRLSDIKDALEANNFSVSIADDTEHANKIVSDLMSHLTVRTLSRGGSTTADETGIFDTIRDNADYTLIDPFAPGLSVDEKYTCMRTAFSADMYITGTNAVTEDGVLVNLDNTGNRVAAITFGPTYVVILVGRNKIVPDLDDAIVRVKDYAAPLNAMRLGKKVPCVATGRCSECSTPDRICNTWTITEKSRPKGRIHVILINADLGY